MMIYVVCYLLIAFTYFEAAYFKWKRGEKRESVHYFAVCIGYVGISLLHILGIVGKVSTSH